MNRRETVPAIVKKKALPEFRSEDEEREFWHTHDSTEFIDWRSADRRNFPCPADRLKKELRRTS